MFNRVLNMPCFDKIMVGFPERWRVTVSSREIYFCKRKKNSLDPRFSKKGLSET